MTITPTYTVLETAETRVGQTDLKLEVITIPVSDLDRAKEFYGGLGWRLDADFSHGTERTIQFTPPGSQCSIHFGTKSAPASAQGPGTAPRNNPSNIAAPTLFIDTRSPDPAPERLAQ
jgi:catechol 2,3-dioxygenase-like lactoylglutathione lyase family enzyme